MPKEGRLTAVDGVYRLTVNATGVTDASATAGVGNASVTWVKDALAPTVASVETLATNPRNIVVPHLDVTFSEAIDAGANGFSLYDLATTTAAGWTALATWANG